MNKKTVVTTEEFEWSHTRQEWMPKSRTVRTEESSSPEALPWVSPSPQPRWYWSGGLPMTYGSGSVTYNGPLSPLDVTSQRHPHDFED